MPAHRAIVIGASSGGVEALRILFKQLDADINAALFVVLHIFPGVKSHLPEVLSYHANINVVEAQDGQKIMPQTAYIAPPDRHLLIQDGTIHLTFGPKVNHTRPAIDPLFVSAASVYGPNTIGVVLSGNLYDGTKGLMSIKQVGGTAVVQDPQEAMFPSMPETALRYVDIDYSVPIMDMAPLLRDLANRPVPEKGQTSMAPANVNPADDEFDLIKEEIKSFEEGDRSNHSSVLTCPDCGGVLWELKNGKLLRYRCHTGHIYNAETLVTSHNEEIEKAFWTAIRVLVEKAAVSNRLAINARESGDWEQELYHLSVARDAEKQAQLIRETWLNSTGIDPGPTSSGEEANKDITRSTG